MDILRVIETLKGENELMLFNPSTGEVGSKYRLTDVDRDFYEAHEFCVGILQELVKYRQIGEFEKVEKMKPKRASYVRTGYVLEEGETEEKETYGWECPACGDTCLHEFDRYCSYCGQAIDWSESEESHAKE